MTPWIGSTVQLTWMPELGRWRCVGREHGGWQIIIPLDQPGIDLAEIGSDGMLWVRRRDLTRCATQTEELF